MIDLVGDLRVAARGLAARPGFALVIVLTLGLGIGATTAIFSAVSALLLRPFPFPAPDRLVRISTVRGDEEGPLSVPEQDDLATLTHIFQDVALYTDQGMYNASGFGAPEELQATITTHNLFRILGVPLAVGAPYDASTDRSRRFELVISHGLWMRRFGGDPNIVGRTMTLDGAPGYTIHGVLAEGVNFPTNSDLFRSSGIAEDPRVYERRDVRQRLALARLQPGVTVAQAQAEAYRLAERLARDHPASNAGVTFEVQALRDLYVGNVRAYLWLLFAAVVLVLLMACANVANLLLSRAIIRDREQAVRLALGAGRGRLIRLALVESVVLAVAGGAAGLAVAVGGLRLVRALVSVDLPPWMRIDIDPATLAFLMVASLGAGLLAGLAPALSASDRRLHDTLREGGRGAVGTRHNTARNVLVVAQVALAVLLLAGASLMLQSVRGLLRVDPGFETDRLLAFRVEMGWRAYATHDKVIRFNTGLMDRLRGLPGVTHVAADSNLPLSGRPREPYEIAAEGQSVAEQQSNPYVHAHVVSAGYFETMGIPILAGRGFVETDTREVDDVVVVSRSLADRLWPGSDPVGRRMRIGAAAAERAPRWSVVVGVARDIRLQQLAGGETLDVYRPHRQMWVNGFWFLIRTAQERPERLAQAATAFVSQIDGDQSFFDVRAMDERVRLGIWQQRAAGALFGAFAAVALALAAVGLYGVLSYLVAQRQREIGVRLALGASLRAVLVEVLGGGLRLTFTGLAIGLLLATVAMRSVAHLTYGIPAIDVTTFVLVPVVLLAVAVAACYLPARRATRVDPLVALRSE